jgi:hypothetical protein
MSNLALMMMWGNAQEEYAMDGVFSNRGMPLPST